VGPSSSCAQTPSLPSSCPWIPVSPAAGTCTHEPQRLQPRSSCEYKLLHVHSWPRFPSSQCRQNRDLPTQERLRKELSKKTGQTAMICSHTPSPFYPLTFLFPHLFLPKSPKPLPFPHLLFHP